MHLVTTPLNIFFSKLTPRAARSAKIENIEEAESLGISKLEEFSWKRRLDFDACVECGRCQAACPAYLAGTRAQPQADHRQAQAPHARRAAGPDPRRADQGRRAVGLHHLHGVRAGVPGLHRHRGHDHRPAALSHALRGRAALDRAAVAAEHPARRQPVGAAGRPSGWRGPQGLDVPVLEPGKEVEYLYWVGCSASYDRRNQAIARSVVAILKKAGVSFAVMQEERCHGEVARRLGEEYLYQTLQAENVEAINQYKFQQGHHALPALLQHDQERVPAVRRHLRGAPPLAGDRRADPERPHQADQAAGRHAWPSTTPATSAATTASWRRRAAWRGAVPGLRVIDPPRARERGLCCGGGGGHMWMEVKAEKRVNIIRTEELLETGASWSPPPAPSAWPWWTSAAR